MDGDMSEITPLLESSMSVSKSKSTVDVSVEEVEEANNDEVFDVKELSKWDTRKTYFIWLLVCFSTGPTATMLRAYVPAIIQTTAHRLGHPKGSSGPCALRGDDCYVRFGFGEVQYTSYSLYLKAIYTSIEGVLAILLMAFADYSDYRKWLMVGATAFYGVFAIPFFWLADTEHYGTLVQQSVLYCLMLCFSTVYQITESSYIPVFMNARRVSLRTGDDNNKPQQGAVISRGLNVSTWGLVVGNIGGLLASLVGVIITHVNNKPYGKDFLLAVTIAGIVTAVISFICAGLVPSLKGKEIEIKGFKNLLLAPIVRFKTILSDLIEYKEALKFCVAWVIWNVAYSNFLAVFGLLFRSTLGIGSSDAEFTVWQFTNLIIACVGPLFWTYVYSRKCYNMPNTYGTLYMKRSLCAMLTIGMLANFWGCLGANSNSKVGFKNRWEFWTFQVLFVGTSTGIRMINRVVYSAVLPLGKENQYFGFEIMLGLCTGWSESLFVALIQDKTGNSRMPFIPNTVLYLVALVILIYVDIEAGMKKVKKWY